MNIYCCVSFAPNLFCSSFKTTIALLQQQRELPLMNVHRIGLNNKAGTLYVIKLEPLIKAPPPQPQGKEKKMQQISL